MAQLEATDRRSCAEGVVGDRLPVRLHRRRYGHQDRLGLDPSTKPIKVPVVKAAGYSELVEFRKRLGLSGYW